LVTHIFCPLISQSPSPVLTAVVLIAATSDPSSGSDRLNAARISPVAIRGSSRCFCSSDPNFINRYEPMKCVFTTPEIEIHPRESSSTIIAYVVRSKPIPPYSSGMVVPNSPSSFICSTIGSGNSSSWS
jgi:hypothetical protein